MIRAPVAGVVKDILIRNGQRIEPAARRAVDRPNRTTEGLSVSRSCRHPIARACAPTSRCAWSCPAIATPISRCEVRAISAQVVGAAEARARTASGSATACRCRGRWSWSRQARLARVRGRRRDAIELHDGMVGAASRSSSSRARCSRRDPRIALAIDSIRRLNGPNPIARRRAPREGDAAERRGAVSVAAEARHRSRRGQKVPFVQQLEADRLRRRLPARWCRPPGGARSGSRRGPRTTGIGGRDGAADAGAAARRRNVRPGAAAACRARHRPPALASRRGRSCTGSSTTSSCSSG